MIQARTDLKPGNWQITATTIRCDYVDDDVTLMVDRDWTTICAWYRRYKQKALDGKKQKFDKEISIKIEKCAGSECPLAINYRDKLIQEELGTK
jgi:hypothetical protein